MSNDTIEVIQKVIVNFVVFTVFPVVLIHFSLHLGWWESIGLSVAIKFASRQGSAERCD